MVTSYPLTHTPLTLAEAQDVIDSIFSPSPTPTDTKPQINPSPSHPGQITHLTQLSSLGTFNTIYLLHFSQQNTSAANGSFQSYPHLVLKLAPPPSIRLLRYESTPTPLLAIEAYLLNHLSTHNNPPLPVPRVLAYDDTLTILDSPYLLTTFLPGIPLNRHRDSFSPAQLQNVDFQVGRLLRAINEVPAGGGSGGYGGTWGMVTGKPGGNSWEWVSEFIEGLLRDGEDIRILLPYGDIRRAVRVWGRFLNFNDEHLQLKSELGDNADTNSNVDTQQMQNLDKDILNNPPTNPKLCILDFSDKNILVDPETCSITGIIDFERAFWGDPVAQEIFLLYGESMIGRKEIVLRGYNSWEYPQPQAHSESHSSSSPGIENMKLIAKRARRRRIRELIYTILSATTRILQLYYRQISSSDREEMVHRKRLVEALGELGELEAEILSS